MTMQPGEILASKYRVDGVLGVGGMGTVLEATHLELEQKVAIKLPHAAQVTEATFATRFMREGKNAAKIRSDHVARVLDVGRTDGGTPFLVMEYLEGHDLSRHLKAIGRFSVADAVDIVLQACDAVAAAHAVGIVHRDLKPANLFLERRNDGSFHVKILDFGISKVLVDDPAALEAALTSTTGVIGSPMYMSPEQMIAARSVDTRTDVWSLGLILYKCLTGKTPWPSGNVIELAARIAKDPPVSPRSLVPDIPVGLEKAILHCLEKDRDKRVASALDFAVAIAPFDPGRGDQTLKRMRRATSTRLPTPSPMPIAIEPETLATSAYTLQTELEDSKRVEQVVVHNPPPAPAEPYTDATTGPVVRRPGSGTRLAVVAGVVAVALLIGVVAVLRTATRAPASASEKASEKTTETPIAKPALKTPVLPEPTTEATPEPTTVASTSASAKATTAPVASVKAPTKPTVKPPKEWDGPSTTTTSTSKSKSPDPWGNW